LPSGKIWEDEDFESLKACREKQRNGRVAKSPNKTVFRGHIQVR